MAKKTHELALCGVLCALAVAFLWLSGIIPLSTYAWPILASATLLPAREECRKSYAWSCFAAAAVLGLLLCADKEAALVFCFLGYYPLVKPNLDAISSKALRLFAKLGLCTVSMGVMYAFIIFVFKLPAVVQEFYHNIRQRRKGNFCILCDIFNNTFFDINLELITCINFVSVTFDKQKSYVDCISVKDSCERFRDNAAYSCRFQAERRMFSG